MARQLDRAWPAIPTTRRSIEIVIGNNVISAPANAIRFERDRPTASPTGSTSICIGPICAATARPLRNDFNNVNGVKRIVFLSFEERMMSRDMSGRFEPIYRSLIDTPGKRRPGRHHLFRFQQEVRLHERGAGGRRSRPAAEPFVARCLSGRAPRNRWRLRARHPCRRRSQPVLPVPGANCSPTGRRSTQAGRRAEAEKADHSGRETSSTAQRSAGRCRGSPSRNCRTSPSSSSLKTMPRNSSPT